MKLFAVIFAFFALCVALGQAQERKPWPCNRDAQKGWTKFCYQKLGDKTESIPCTREAKKGWTKFCYQVKNK